MTAKATMSLDRFMEYLEKTKDLYDWKMANGGYLRAFTPGSSATQIRFHLNQARAFCPITAVYDSLFGGFTPLGEYEQAGKALGLSAATMSTIVIAADGGYVDLSKTRIRKASKAKRLRQQMEQLLQPSQYKN